MEFSAPLYGPVIRTTNRMHVHIVRTDREPFIALWSLNSPSERNLRFSVPCGRFSFLQFCFWSFSFYLNRFWSSKVRVYHCTIQYIHSRALCYQTVASLQSGLKSKHVCGRRTAQCVSCNISCNAKDIIKIMILCNGCITRHSTPFTVETISQ